MKTEIRSIEDYKKELSSIRKSDWGSIELLLEQAALDSNINLDGMLELNNIADDIYYGRIRRAN